MFKHLLSCIYIFTCSISFVKTQQDQPNFWSIIQPTTTATESLQPTVTETMYSVIVLPTTETITETETETTTKTKTKTKTKYITTTSDCASSSINDNFQKNCLDEHNRVRRLMGLSDLISGTPEQIECAFKNAEENSMYNVPHTSTCNAAQNECPHFSNMRQCLDAYYSEGPAPGLSHYNNIKYATLSVSCGYKDEGNGLYWYTHNYI